MVEIGHDITVAAQYLRQGKLVAIPTETVYGLAADATNTDAVTAVFSAKNRPHFDPLIIHLPDMEAIKPYAELQDERLIKLADRFWPGPLTLLLDKKDSIPEIVTSGLPKVAVRIPNHNLTLALLKSLNFPLAAPSANPFGYVSPTKAEHVMKQLGDKVKYILDGGPCEIGIESTIIGIEDGEVCIYRLGGLTIEEIAEVIGEVKLKLNQSDNPTSPGQLTSHYAPGKKLLIGDIGELIDEHHEEKIALLLFGEDLAFGDNITEYNLSRSYNLNEAAANLFMYLRQIDESDADLIIADYLPDIGLGKAINDRLKRAQFQG